MAIRSSSVPFGDGQCFALQGMRFATPFGLAMTVLIRVDERWLIADVLEHYDWFDAENKNNPDFDVEKLISN